MYYLARNFVQTGPFTLEEVRAMWVAGALPPQTLYWQKGMMNWEPIAELAAVLGAPASFSGNVALPGGLTGGSGGPPSTSREPSAYDLPASRLPPAPAGAGAGTPARSGSLIATGATPPGALQNSLIAPTRLPASGTTPRAPIGSAYPGSGPFFPPALDSGPQRTPPAAFLSVFFALFGPVLIFFVPIAGWLVGGGMLVAGVVCGHTAREGIRRSGNRLPGMGLATTGIVLGYLGMILGAVFVTTIIGLFAYAIATGGSPRHFLH